MGISDGFVSSAVSFFRIALGFRAYYLPECSPGRAPPRGGNRSLIRTADSYAADAAVLACIGSFAHGFLRRQMLWPLNALALVPFVGPSRSLPILPCQ